jgi:hypothetical protein
MDSYILRVHVYTYDSDHYEERFEEIKFSTLDELKEFYGKFKQLPTDDIPYFGKSIDMNYFNDLYCQNKNGCHFWLDTGGVSAEHALAFKVTRTEIQL